MCFGHDSYTDSESDADRKARQIKEAQASLVYFQEQTAKAQQKLSSLQSSSN